MSYLVDLVFGSLLDESAHRRSIRRALRKVHLLCAGVASTRIAERLYADAWEGLLPSNLHGLSRDLTPRQRPESLKRRHFVQMVQKVQRIVIHPQRAGALQFTDIVASRQ